MSYRYLSTPLSVAGITLANRIVMPPLVIWKAGLDGLVTDDHIAHYRQSAGPGLCIVEATAVSPEGRLAATQLGAWSDDHTVGLARLAATIHDAGAVAGIQIHHAGGRTSAAKNGDLPILVPSRTGQTPQTAVALTAAEIGRIISDFGTAAGRCIAAGFDVIEIHGAHGYLGSQFLAPSTNHRTDEWGGSLENRVRFLCACLLAVRERAMRAERPVVVSVRLGVADAAAPELTVADGCEAARLLEQAGAELLHVSHAGSPPATDGSARWSTTLELARRVKAAVKIRVIGVGGVKNPFEADLVLADGVADLIAVGRAMLADPEWAAKAMGNEAASINLCIDCKPRCFHFTEPLKCPPRRRAALG